MAKKELNQNKEQRRQKEKSATYFGSVAAVAAVIVLVVTIVLINAFSNKTVMTIENHQIKKDFYTCVYFCNTIPSKSFADYGFDSQKNPYEQAFDHSFFEDEEGFETWGDYFDALTQNTLKFLYIMTDTAAEGGYTYTDQVEENVQKDLSNIDANKPTALSFKAYMSQQYGAPVSKALFEKYLRLYYQASEFYQSITRSKALFDKYIGTSEDDFQKVYEEQKDQIDVFSFRYVAVNDYKVNAEVIERLKQAKSQEQFRDLCNAYKQDETYTENDSSLYTDISLSSLSSAVHSSLSQKLLAGKMQAGEIYYADGEINGKDVIEFVYIVTARHKDTSAYEESDVQQWEFAAMEFLLEEYGEAHFTCAVSETGLKAFQESIVTSA